jgi:hypothetical protein
MSATDLYDPAAPYSPAASRHPLGCTPYFGKTVQGGALGEDLHQHLGVVLRELPGGRLVAQPLDQVVRGRECLLQRYLLIALHTRM